VQAQSANAKLDIVYDVAAGCCKELLCLFGCTDNKYLCYGQKQDWINRD